VGNFDCNIKPEILQAMPSQLWTMKTLRVAAKVYNAKKHCID
jgi:hypothetical protein